MGPKSTIPHTRDLYSHQHTYSTEHQQTHPTSTPQNEPKNKRTPNRNTHPNRATWKEITPPTQLEIETIPPPAAKRPKTLPCPQSPVLPGLCAATRTPEETPRRERRNQTQSGGNTEIVRTQEPEQTPPGAKRPTAAEWDGMSRNQKRRWRQWPMAQIGWGLHYIIFLRALAETYRKTTAGPNASSFPVLFSPPFFSGRGGPPPVFGGVGFGNYSNS